MISFLLPSRVEVTSESLYRCRTFLESIGKAGVALGAQDVEDAWSARSGGQKPRSARNSPEASQNPLGGAGMTHPAAGCWGDGVCAAALKEVGSHEECDIAAGEACGATGGKGPRCGEGRLVSEEGTLTSKTVSTRKAKRADSASRHCRCPGTWDGDKR